MAEEIHFDCLILGAGISGLDAAYHIQVILYQINIEFEFKCENN